MSKDPAFPFYAQDFLTGVMHLTMEERGIYITLLSYQWAHDKIPKKRVGLILGYEWDSLSDELKCKFKIDGNYIQNERLEVEREKRRVFKAKQRINGMKGGRPLKAKLNPTNNPNVSQTITQKNPLEDEYESEKEVEYHIDDAYEFLKENSTEQIEIFEIQQKKTFPDFNLFVKYFNNVVIKEEMEWKPQILLARLRMLNDNWDKTPKKEQLTATENLNKALGI